MQSKKDIFIFSNYCHFCKDVMIQMEKYNLKNQFVMLCADTNKYRLPSEIDRVPAILIQSENGNMKILFEDDITSYLQSFASPQERVSGCGGMFSYINDQDENIMGGESGNYGIFGVEQHIYTPEENDGDIMGNKTQGSINYDRLVSERDMDIKRYMK